MDATLLHLSIFPSFMLWLLIFLCQKNQGGPNTLSPRKGGHKTMHARHARVDNPRPNSRAANPTNPKIGQNTRPISEFPHMPGDPKIPREHQKNTPTMRFWYFLGVLGGISRGISVNLTFCMFGGIFACHCFSFSVAGQRVLNARGVKSLILEQVDILLYPH